MKVKNPFGGDMLDVGVVAAVLIGGYLFYQHYVSEQNAEANEAAALAAQSVAPANTVSNANPGNEALTDYGLPYGPSLT
jgi:uncharacterized membrane protein YebE (DUF533 family)